MPRRHRPLLSRRLGHHIDARALTLARPVTLAEKAETAKGGLEPLGVLVGGPRRRSTQPNGFNLTSGPLFIWWPAWGAKGPPRARRALGFGLGWAARVRPTPQVYHQAD